MVVTVGRPARLLEPAIAEYEARAARYWPLETASVKAEKGGKPDAEVKRAEAERLAGRVPDGFQTIALTREGKRWSSEKLARHLQGLALRSAPGAAFLIGGALGLGDALVSEADARLSLSDFTMPHDLARLVLAEQLYRAGTIARGEPYHKG